MKKMILSAAVIASIMFTSCNNFLDVKPTDLLTEDVALQNYTDFSNALSGAYSGLTSGSYYGGTFYALAEVPADNLKYGPGATGLYQFLYNLNYTTDTGEFIGFYQQAYLAIYRVNVMLEKLDNSTLTAAQKNQIRSEALMIRALAHHDLVRVFAQRYNATGDASHDGIAIKTSSSITPPARNTVKEVYNQVIADIDAALAILPTTGGPSRFTQRSAHALRARVAMYMRDWSQAETSATNAITGGPALATTTTYTNMWTTSENDGECIFKLKMPVGSAALGSNYWNVSAGNDYFTPTTDILNEYQAGDIRYNAFFKVHPSGPANRMVVKKYEGSTANPGLADIKVLRMSEMYLIRSEALARKSSPDETASLADLNAVRTARGRAAGTETGTALVDAIMKERRLEFFLEGHRWFDIVREQQSINRADCNSTTCSLAAGNYRFTYPIPQQEIFANKNMKQNPGW